MRFPVLPMPLGVNTSVKRWVTAQCGGCESRAAHSPAAVIFLPAHIQYMHAINAPVNASYMQGSN